MDAIEDAIDVIDVPKNPAEVLKGEVEMDVPVEVVAVGITFKEEVENVFLVNFFVVLF